MAEVGVEVYEACRHLVVRTATSGEVARSCRLGAGREVDGAFACAPGCLFLEERTVDDAGWAQAPAERMSNTADGLANLPKSKKPKKPKRT